MPQRRELSRYRTAVDSIGKQLLQETAHVVASSIQQRAFVAIKNGRELVNVSGVGGNGKRSKSLFDFQIVNEVRNDSGVCLGRHKLSMRVIGHNLK